MVPIHEEFSIQRTVDVFWMNGFKATSTAFSEPGVRHFLFPFLSKEERDKWKEEKKKWNPEDEESG